MQAYATQYKTELAFASAHPDIVATAQKIPPNVLAAAQKIPPDVLAIAKKDSVGIGGARDALAAALGALDGRLPYADAAERLHGVLSEVDDVVAEVRQTRRSRSTSRRNGSRRSVNVGSC